MAAILIRGALAVAAGGRNGSRSELGIAHQVLVLNGLLTEPLAGDAIADAYAAAEAR